MTHADEVPTTPTPAPLGENVAASGAIEERLGIPAGFTRALLGEGTDWEFAVKLAVLLEAALSKVVAAHLHNEAVERHVERLNLNGRTGKIALAQDLGVLTKSEARALLALSEVRNMFAHRVENLAADLSHFAQGMSDVAREKFFRDGLMIPADAPIREFDFLWLGKNFEIHIRLLMWMMAESILVTLANQDEHATRERKRREWLENLAASKTKGGLPALAGAYGGGLESLFDPSPTTKADETAKATD